MTMTIDNVQEHEDMSTEERINLRNVKGVRDYAISLDEKIVKLAAALELVNQNHQALQNEIQQLRAQFASTVAMMGGGGPTGGS